MSGPKSYSVEVFDNNLKSLFLLQNEIVTLWQFLSSQKISDSVFKVEITSNDFLKKHLAQFQGIRHPFIKNFEGEINQGQFNKFYNQIHAFIEKQHKLKQVLQEQKEWFQTLEGDFAYHLESQKLLVKCREEFAVLKHQMLGYLDTLNLNEQGRKEKTSDLEKVVFSFELPAFSVETAKKQASHRKALLESYERSRKKLGAVLEASIQTNPKQIVKESVKLVSSSKNYKTPEYSAKEITVIIRKIEVLLNQLNDSNIQHTLAERLLNLRHDINIKNQYFFIELYEEVKKQIRQQEYRGELHKINQELSGITFVSSMDEEIQKFKRHIGEVERRDVVKRSDVDNVSGLLASLVEKNQNFIQKNQIQKQERRYIKARLVAALHDLNYEVVSDAQVIDLDSTEGLLLQVSDQQNFINLRFNNSGQLLYNYLIPEDRNFLSHDEKVKKMAGMEDTCNEFKKMLEGLQEQGLNVALKNEMPITEKSLIKLPEKYHKIIKHGNKKGAGSTKALSQKRKMSK